MPKLIINNKTFTYFVKRKRIRSLNLHFLSPSSFYISCHYLTPTLVINRFIKTNQLWILKKSQKFTSYPKLKNLKKLTILDQQYLVIYIKSSKNSLKIDNNSVSITIQATNLSQKNLKTILEKYLKLYAKKLITNQINLYPEYKKLVKSIRLRNQKTRFGSCSSRQNLSFNWQIIFFPPDLFNHIICHELVHLVEKNHQKSFYQKLSLLDPDWKANNRRLKTQARKHFLIKP